jgi:voltage-gated potassium channel
LNGRKLAAMALQVRELLGSPSRTLASAICFVVGVAMLATIAYMAAGWSLADASYMVALTIWTVGYEEVRPISTPYLHAVTMGTMALGCTGMIILTGALVQFLTVSQIAELFGKRVTMDVKKLNGHVIVCGFGRIGVMLAKDLAASGRQFVVLERSEAKLREASNLGYAALAGDATDEVALLAAGVERAAVLATVLPDDAANVFITLSARALNPKLQIIARGEAPSTESKLLHAGANKVVLPTHIGAERIAEMILFSETISMIRGSESMASFERQLRGVGLELEVVISPEDGAFNGLTIAEAERRGKGGFFVIQINHRDGETIVRPDPDVKIGPGDGLMVVAKGDVGKLAALFNAPKEAIKTGRMYSKPRA